MDARTDTTINEEMVLLDRLMPIARASDGLKPRSWNVLKALHSWGKNSGQWYPSNEKIGDRSMCDARTVKRAMVELSSLGFVLVEERPGTSNKYSFDFNAIDAFICAKTGVGSFFGTQDILSRGVGQNVPPPGTKCPATQDKMSRGVGQNVPRTLNQNETEPEKELRDNSKPGGADPAAQAFSDSDSGPKPPPTFKHAEIALRLAVSGIWCKSHKGRPELVAQHNADRISTERMADQLWDEKLPVKERGTRILAACYLATSIMKSSAEIRTTKMALWTYRVKHEILGEKKAEAVA